MALTTRQQTVAQSPWSALEEELLTVMQILGDRAEWSQFGERRYAVLLQLHRAALSRNLIPPEPFNSQVRNLSALGSITVSHET